MGLLVSNCASPCQCGPPVSTIRAIHSTPSSGGGSTGNNGNTFAGQGTVVGFCVASGAFNYDSGGATVHRLQLQLAGPMSGNFSDINGIGPLSIAVYNGIKGGDINGALIYEDGPLQADGLENDWECTPGFGLDWFLDGGPYMQDYFPNGLTFISNWYATWPPGVGAVGNELIQVTISPVIVESKPGY